MILLILNRIYLIIFCLYTLFFVAVTSVSAQSAGLQPSASAQDTSLAAIDSVSSEKRWVTIDKIFIVGNRQTKESIILRELGLEEGEQLLLSELHKIIEQDKRKIMNTRLFLSVNISIIEITDRHIDLIIRVVERWYTVPSLYIKLADRNFNEWFTNQNMEWDRLEYGLRFFRYNFRGRNEKLYLYAQGGFTKKFAFRYTMPYIDKAQKNGLEFSFSFSETNNIAYESRDHILMYTDSLRKSKLTWFGSTGWTFRPSFYDVHSITLGYKDNTVSDTIAVLNPNYFQDGATHQKYFELTYRYINDKRDAVGYPLHGQYWGLEFSKLGLGIFNDINLLQVKGFYSRFMDLGKGFFYGGSVRGYLSTPKNQPYAEFIGFGYNSVWPRGYELNVIEGQSYLLQQNTFSFRIFSHEFDLSKLLSIDQFNQIPIDIYLKTYYDHGFVSNTIDYEQSNRLANQYLFGGGVGLDIVTYYDSVLRLEYSWNSDGNAGIRISAKKPF